MSQEDGMKLVFVCSPLRGDRPRNVELARGLCNAVIDSGNVPVAPHLIYPQFLDDRDDTQRSLGILCGLHLLRRCDEIWYFHPEGILSAGMEAELVRARLWRKPIYRINSIVPLEIVSEPYYCTVCNGNSQVLKTCLACQRAVCGRCLEEHLPVHALTTKIEPTAG